MSVPDFFSTSSLTFLLVFLAEFGDKSQLVCMTLAAKHRAVPIIAGAVTAFAALNLIAVLFGQALANWIPELWLTIIVAVLFAVFGVQSLLAGNEDDEQQQQVISNRTLFLTALSMIFLAEFGDKTQLAVAGMASSYNVVSVWVGSTIALAATTVLGVFAGKALLQRLPIALIHKLSGILFLILAAVALLSLI